MTTEEINSCLADLESTDVTRRLEAARVLSRTAGQDQLAILRRFLRIESDELVARVLRRTVRALDLRRPVVDDAQESEGVDAEVATRVRTLAVRESTGMFLHEVSPLVGSLEVVAARMIDQYEGSPLYEAVERIRETLAAFEDLRSATDASQPAEFNLTETVAAVTRQVVGEYDSAKLSAESGGTQDAEPDELVELPTTCTRVTLARDDPVISVGAQRLVKLVLVNAIRNAIEACEAVLEERSAAITISWGTTDVDSWVSVVDDGPGLPAALETPWAVGATSKADAGHRGLGLVIVDQATETMRGDADLVDGETGGCHFEIRWPHKGGSE